VAIGDIHGSYAGLLELLYEAKITSSPETCTWREQGPNKEDGVVLVQVGDLVDRGPDAWGAFDCLRTLQKEAEQYNSKVVRLVGSKNKILKVLYLYCSYFEVYESYFWPPSRYPRFTQLSLKLIIFSSLTSRSRHLVAQRSIPRPQRFRRHRASPSTNCDHHDPRHPRRHVAGGLYPHPS